MQGKEAVMYDIMMTNHHEGHGRKRTFADCSCVQVPASAVVAGDFLYHYSDQLDSFTLWEVMSTNREKGTCEIRTIDCDSPEVAYYADGRGYGDGEVPLRDGYNKFYHPDSADRARVERDGFATSYVSMWPAHSRPAQRRQLFLKLYYRTPVEKVKEVLQVDSFLRRLQRWFLGY